jgi:hypothetical protein
MQQGEDPIASLGAGAAGALGGAAGLLASRQLAGRYNPQLIMNIQKGISGAGNVVGDYARNLPESSTVRKKAAEVAADVVSAVDNRLMGIPGEANALIPFPTQNVQRNVGKGVAAGLVPATAAAAGLGGMAAGQAISAIGNMAGLAIDPEAPGSSNTSNSRVSMQMPAMRMY